MMSRKPECRYGSKCYRKSEDHLRSFDHPEDVGSPKRARTSDSPLGGNHSTDYLEFIKENFLITMPRDFFEFWEFCKSLNPEAPEESLRDVGLRLVGPYDVLSGKIEIDCKYPENSFLCHWRYFYDPPEFTTVLSSDANSGFHIGYFRDDPLKEPLFLCSNSAKLDCVFTPVGGNIFTAVMLHIQSAEKSCSIFSKNKLLKIVKLCKNWAKCHNFPLEESTSAMKLRQKDSVGKTFHNLGIVVPIDKNTKVGYREIPESKANLKKLLKKIADCSSEEQRKLCFDPLHELITNVQFANDEGDPGMGLELGLNLFSYGKECFHTPALQLLSMAYELLDREPFIKIIEAHLATRKVDDLSCIPPKKSDDGPVG